MQIKRLVFVALLFLIYSGIKSQIRINELNVSNITGTVTGGPTVSREDYVELYNDGTLPEPLGNYYLTNDRSNLFKWHCPTSSMAVGSFTVIWMSGRDYQEPAPTKRWHTNFTIDQCKNQWLMLVRNNGVIVDSVFIRRTKADDTRFRYPDGANTWFVCNGCGTFPSTGWTFEASNSPVPPSKVFIDYAPMPTFSTAPGFTPSPTGNYTMWIPDTVNFQINYTITDCNSTGTIGATVPCSAEYPVTTCTTPGSQPTAVYVDDISTPFPNSGMTEVIRAITIPKTSNTSYTVPGTYAATLYTVNIAQLYLPSFCQTNTYFDGTDLAVNNGFACVSICMAPSFTTSAASQTIHVEYFDKYQFYSEGYSNVSKGANDNWDHQQVGFNVGFKDERGFGCALTGDIFNDPGLGVSTRTFLPTFGIKVAGEDNFSAMTPTSSTNPPPIGAHMRDAFANTYGIISGLNLDGLHYKPIKGYFNGCYSGVYEFRELADWYYVNHYYGHDKDSIDILEQYGGPIINHGTDTSWVSSTPVSIATSTVGVFNQIRSFPMYVAQFYDRVMKRFNKKSFMDFMIYNSYLVNADLMSYNNSWWRGYTPSVLRHDSLSEEWKYFMWDLNDIYDLRPPTRSLTATNVSVTPCVYNTIPVLTTTVANTYSTQASAYTSHGYILNRLLQNNDFRNEYINRYMDLLNTTLRCDKMLAHFDYIEKILEPEMIPHAAYWGVNESPDWENNRDTLRARIQERCTAFEKQLTTCMNLLGPLAITIDVKPAGAGNVIYNSLHLNSYPWSGNYYQNKTAPYLETFLQALPIDTTAYVFDHWEFSSTTNSTTASPYDLNHTGALKDDSISCVILQGDNIVAVFADKRDDIVMPTGFTPNGDGKNDIFRPLGAASRYARDYDFEVYNRWGQQVYKSTDSASGWDGYYNGSQAQTGVYAYIIKYKNVLDQNKLIKGNVTLLR